MSSSPEKPSELKAKTSPKTQNPLVEQMKEIILQVEQIPEYYRTKAFEVLLTQRITGNLLPIEIPKLGAKSETATLKKFIVPIDARAFLQQYSIPEEKLQKLFFMEGKEVRPTYQITTTKKSRSQIQVALIIALETALNGGKYEFGMEAVRTRCQDLRCYDKDNFTAHFKNNQKLFKTLTDPEHIELSPDGKSELAEVILEIAK